MTNPYGRFVEDPLSASGYRWKRHNEPEPTSMLPAVKPSPRPKPDLPEVPPRVDDWCEDRPPTELSNEDATE